ncbi:MAG: LytR family transcriptional regulator [Microbacteriaceae bacterium]|nr:MAG: LytR family transcriptional regulator [Microbacteriaceae bacterium]
MSDEQLKRDRSRRARVASPGSIARHGRLPRSRAWVTVLAFLGAAMSVVLVATTAVAGIAIYQFTSDVGDKAVDINDGSAAPIPEIGAYEGGFNILVVGSDEYHDRDSVLNDVNMLVHVSADQTSAVAVSFPRDMVVPFPGCVNPKTGKTWGIGTGLPINNALYYGGLPCVVNVIENFTGLDIQYAGMIGFDGVANLATAVGGVQVCLTRAIHDKDSGIQLEAGTHYLSGWDALAFLRTRKGVGDGSDLSRIASQQAFLSALLRKLKSEETLTNVGKLLSLANVARDNMTLSTELSQPATMVAMAKALSRIPMDRITFVQYPGTTGGTGIYAGKVQPDKNRGTLLMDAIRADQPIGVEKPADGTSTEVDPNAPQQPVDPSASPSDAPVLPDKVVISGVRGQTAADQTCTRGNG